MSVSPVAKPDPEKLQNMIADQLTAQGFSEIMNNSLTKSEYIEKNKDFSKEKNVELLNPLSSDLDVLRQTLLFGGLEVIAYNNNRKVSDLKLYEFGKIYQKKENFDKARGIKNYFEEKHLSFFVTGKAESENWDSSDKNVDFFFLKGTVENVFKKLGIDPEKLTLKESTTNNSNLAIEYFNGQQLLAVVAVLNKKLSSEFDIKKEVIVANINWDRALSLVPRNEIYL